MGRGIGSDDELPRRIQLLAPQPSVQLVSEKRVALAYDGVEVTALERFLYDEDTETAELLEEGSKLKLVRVRDNDKDPYCVAVYRAEDDLRLGYVSAQFSREIGAAIDDGYEFEAELSEVEPGPVRVNNLRYRAGRAWASVQGEKILRHWA